MSDTIELNKKERLFLVNQLEIIKNQKLIIATFCHKCLIMIIKQEWQSA